MNAKEARATAGKANTDNENAQYAHIKAEIENKANDGKYETFYHQTLMKNVHEKLVEEGFTVHSYDSRNDILMKISW